MRTPTPVSAFALLLALVAPLSAQNEYEEQVLAQLEVAAEFFIDNGYEPLVWDSGSLRDDARQQFTVTLEEGMSYALVGVCDEDCSDLDLGLFDGEGLLVVEDTEIDDAPLIEFTVTQGGDFTLDVTMYECSVEPCYYGIAVFGW
jgi:hypothetical protein